jgi:hypothetical protein
MGMPRRRPTQPHALEGPPSAPAGNARVSAFAPSSSPQHTAWLARRAVRGNDSIHSHAPASAFITGQTPLVLLLLLYSYSLAVLRLLSQHAMRPHVCVLTRGMDGCGGAHVRRRESERSFNLTPTTLLLAIHK